VWRCLYASCKGILQSGGGNEYCRHRGSRVAHSVSEELGDYHDRKVSSELVEAAELALRRLEEEERERHDSESSSSDSDTDNEDPLASDVE